MVQCIDAAAVLLSETEKVFRDFDAYLHKVTQETAKESATPAASCRCAPDVGAYKAKPPAVEECYTVVLESGKTGAPDINPVEMCDVQFSAVVKKRVAPPSKKA